MGKTASKTKTRSRARTRSRTDIKRILEMAFRNAFPQDTVDVSDGYRQNIHVLVVSRGFDGMSEKEKQQELWRIIDATDLHPSEKRLISLVYPISPAELK